LGEFEYSQKHPIIPGIDEEISKRISNLEERNFQNEKSLHFVKAENSKVGEENRLLAESSESQRQKIISLQAEQSNFCGQISSLVEGNRSLKEQLNSCASFCQAVETELVRLGSENQSLRERLDRVHEELSQAREENKAKCQSQHESNQQLQRELSDLRE
jgi:chromosome segregation ATPase